MNILKYCLGVGEKHLLKVFFESSAAFVLDTRTGSLKEQAAVTAFALGGFVLIWHDPKTLKITMETNPMSLNSKKWNTKTEIY